MKRTKDIHMELAEAWWDKGIHPITGWETFGVERRWQSRQKVNVKRNIKHSNLTKEQKDRALKKIDYRLEIPNTYPNKYSCGNNEYKSRND